MIRDYAEKFSEPTGIEIQCQRWGGNIKLLMEGIDVEYSSSSFDPGNNKERY